MSVNTQKKKKMMTSGDRITTTDNYFTKFQYIIMHAQHNRKVFTINNKRIHLRIQ